jgi:4-hydroxythreonine-4-phosphate dehydrogenase
MAWLARRGAELTPFFIIDDPARLEGLARRLQVDAPIQAIDGPEAADAVFDRALPVLPIELMAEVRPGIPDPANGAAVVAAIDRAAQLALAGRASAIVTNPIHKHTLFKVGFPYPGHTDYLAHLAGGGRPVMMLLCPGLRVAPVTVHVPLQEALKSLTLEAIVTCAETVAAALEHDFGIATPRLAIAGLNPHAGEGGSLGREEIEVVAPAVALLQERGIDADGPTAADSLFHESARARYDAAICMYHDQALIPIKTLDFDHGVNVTLGLPLVRTSPDHGTALGLAGSGRANAASLIAALQTASSIAARREEVTTRVRRA